MTRALSSFKISSGDRIYDYRLGRNLNVAAITSFFQKKDYQVRKIWNDNRHVLGILIKNDISYFLKLSATEGISIVTKKEFDWNNYFNKSFSANSSFRVPKNYDSGFFERKYFYLITDYFKGKLLCDINDTDKASGLSKYIPKVIELSELIQNMGQSRFADRIFSEGDYKKKFIEKVNKWFYDIPIDVRKKFKIKNLAQIVEEGFGELLSKPRHGDFTPWHIIKLKGPKFGLIDGEHALADGVESYDICYFIQRVFSVLKNPHIAYDIYSRLLYKGYIKDKLKAVLAARAIGGFLDESLTDKADYKFANAFKGWIMNI